MNSPDHPPMPEGPLARFLLDPVGYTRHLLEAAQGTAGPIARGVALVAVISLVGYLGLRLVRKQPEARFGIGARKLRIFPGPEVNADGAAILWMGLHALLRPAWKRLVYGQPHLSWEVIARGHDVSIGLWVPSGVPPGLVEQAVQSAWPGARVGAEEPELRLGEEHLASTELALGESEIFPLGEGVGSDPLRLVLGTLGLLSKDESALVQVVARPVTTSGRHRLRRDAHRLRRSQNQSLVPSSRARPAPRSSDPGVDADVRLILEKAASPLWESVIRVAVGSKERQIARGKIHALAGAFGVFAGRNVFVRRHVRGGRKALALRSFRRGYVLSVPELAAIAALPSPQALPGLERATAKTYPAPRNLPGDGKSLGLSNHPNDERRVAIAVADASHHVHLIGETGTGKSTLIARMVLDDARAGRAAVVIDPKGDLVNSIVERLPKGADARTCVLDPTDREVAVGLNMLEGEDPDLAVDHVVSVFKRIWERSWGPRSDDIMRAVCLTLTRIPEATLAEVPLLLTEKEVRAAIRYRRHRFHDLGDVVGFWEQFEKMGEQQRSRDIAPLMNKVRAFLLRGPARAIVGQAKPKLNIPSFIENGGLLLARIPKGTLGEETSRVLGAFVVARVWQACMSRADVPELERRPVGLYVDEMHNYLTLPRSFEDMLAEARAYGLSMVLAHQHLGQLPHEMREALAANARTKIAFACSPDDARHLDRHFAPALTEHDLSSLGGFTAACRPCIGGAHGSPFTFVTEPLATSGEGRRTEVKVAAARFGEDRKAVEARIRVRQDVIKQGKW
jgi:hypothetical protein